jgi:UDP-2,3-diacylglucosamine pyrophosphatase LpxH
MHRHQRGSPDLSDVLDGHAGRIAFAFCGHTHRARQGTWHGIRSYNVGGDYHFKRLLWLTWQSGSISEHQFGDEAR